MTNKWHIKMFFNYIFLADENNQIPLGEFLVWAAAKFGDYQSLESVLQSSFNKDIDPLIKTLALRIAAAEGHEEIVKILLQHGADKKDELARKLAAINGHQNIVKILN